MPTSKQLLLHKNKRKRKYHRVHCPPLKGCPQKKGVCVRVYKESPKKPNSAQRSIAKILLFSTNRNVRAQIPGEGHELQKFSRVLIRGGRVRDLPGIRCRVIRGKLDCKPVRKRCSSISKYGLSKSLVAKIKKEFFPND